jgi:hypothetical protein
MSLAFLDLLALALAWTRLVAHVRGAGEAAWSSFGESLGLFDA